jgi:hypothetical protein
MRVHGLRIALVGHAQGDGLGGERGQGQTGPKDESQGLGQGTGFELHGELLLNRKTKKTEKN